MTPKAWDARCITDIVLHWIKYPPMCHTLKIAISDTAKVISLSTVSIV